MADSVTPVQRSANMARVKGKDTKPEKIVRSILHGMGYRFRLHRKDLPGKPDIVLPKHRKVIFVHGCFWHGHEGCHRSARPSTNKEFWNTKINGNIERDRRSLLNLANLGWSALIVWECEMRNKELLKKMLEDFLVGSSEGQE
jgi:DNA mismatch endonuclease (patch repair protein)